MKVAVHGYHAGKAWLCICDGVEPPFSKSWIRHCDVMGNSVAVNICICDWLWENQPVTHKDNYVEKRN